MHRSDKIPVAAIGQTNGDSQGRGEAPRVNHRPHGGDKPIVRTKTARRAEPIELPRNIKSHYDKPTVDEPDRDKSHEVTERRDIKATELSNQNTYDYSKSRHRHGPNKLEPSEGSQAISLKPKDRPELNWNQSRKDRVADTRSTSHDQQPEPANNGGDHRTSDADVMEAYRHY